jgi:dsRNA-specific ribonuclease
LTVESILGGVFSLHGSPAAQRTFHLHILPALSNQLRDPRLKERAEEMRQAIDREFDGGIVKP